MLSLKRKKGQKIVLFDSDTMEAIATIESLGDIASKLGIDTPDNVRVLRYEKYVEIVKEKVKDESNGWNGR